MDPTHSPVHALTAKDVMNRPPVVIPRQMLVREAARVLRQAKINGAPVVDEQGRCVGMLFPTDIHRWIEMGCPETVIGPVLSCPYQVRGRLLTGEEAVICTLADGSCPFQAVQPTTGGRHTELCMRSRTEDSPFGTVPRYMTTDGVTVRPQTPLPDLIRKMINARIDCLVVTEEQERPVGTVSATDILAVISDHGRG
jgi:CBS domain-containing protein